MECSTSLQFPYSPYCPRRQAAAAFCKPSLSDVAGQHRAVKFIPGRSQLLPQAIASDNGIISLQPIQSPAAAGGCESAKHQSTEAALIRAQFPYASAELFTLLHTVSAACSSLSGATCITLLQCCVAPPMVVGGNASWAHRLQGSQSLGSLLVTT